MSSEQTLQFFFRVTGPSGAAGSGVGPWADSRSAGGWGPRRLVAVSSASGEFPPSLSVVGCAVSTARKRLVDVEVDVHGQAGDEKPLALRCLKLLGRLLNNLGGATVDKGDVIIRQQNQRRGIVVERHSLLVNAMLVFAIEVEGNLEALPGRLE